MKVSMCAMALLASVTLAARAQTFVNLGFEQASLPDPQQGISLTWGQGAPGWNHNESAEGDFLGYPDVNAGFSVSYALFPLSDCCANYGLGSFALAMHSGTFYEHEPRGPFVQASVWQTGVIGLGVKTVSMFASNAAFSLTLDGTVIDMRPVDLDPASPTYETDLQHYGGQWTGDVSAFAGQVVELRINDLALPENEPRLLIDDIRLLPVPEPSTATLLGLGVLMLFTASFVVSRSTPRQSTAFAAWRNSGLRSTVNSS